jgi:tetratricopeptide (TPR) repeat protein
VRDPEYAQAFRQYGVDVAALGPAEVGARIRTTSVPVALAAALDDWALVRNRRRKKGDTTWKDLLAAARAADPDDWRNQVRDALESEPEDQQALKNLASSDRAADQPPSTLVWLAKVLRRSGAVDQAAALLRTAQRRHPGDFWINKELAATLGDQRCRQWEEEARFATAASVLRPQSPGAMNDLGGALVDKGSLDEAIAAYKEAIRLKPDFAQVYNNLGGALVDKGSLDEAVAAYKEAIRLKPDFAEAYHGLGRALRKKGSLDKAIAAYKEAIRLKPAYVMAYDNLGDALVDKGSLDEAVAAYKEAIRLKPDFAEVYDDLGSALSKKGSLDEAVAAHKEAIRLKPDYAEAYCNLGGVLRDKAQFTEALTYLRRGHELGSKSPRWPYPSAQWVKQCEHLVELDGALPAILSGKKQPGDAGQRVEYAQICQMKHLYASAARLFLEAITAQPNLAAALDNGLRYNAACAAALAGCGEGDDKPAPDEKDRARLRRQALDWLRAELAGWRTWRRQQADSEAPAVRDALRKTLQHWREDSDLAGVRDEPALAGLPEAERAEWKAIWADVEKTLAKVQDAAPEGKVKDKP